jgi:hypothetical protein
VALASRQSVLRVLVLPPTHRCSKVRRATKSYVCALSSSDDAGTASLSSTNAGSGGLDLLNLRSGSSRIRNRGEPKRQMRADGRISTSETILLICEAAICPDLHSSPFLFCAHSQIVGLRTGFDSSAYPTIVANVCISEQTSACVSSKMVPVGKAIRAGSKQVQQIWFERYSMSQVSAHSNPH